MKKFTFILILAISTFFNLKAQSPLDEEGYQFSLAGGYGLYGLPVYVGYEFGFMEDITLGIEGSYRNYNESIESGNIKHNIAGVTFFGNYYLNKALNFDKKWAVYAGLGIGYFKWFTPEEHIEKGKSTSTLSVGIQTGVRYYFKDWGILLELAGGSENVGFKIGGCYRIDY